MLSFLSILGEVFVMSHCCKVPLFSNGIKGCHFCWVQFLLDVSDGAVCVGAVCVVCVGASDGVDVLSNCNYLLFYQWFEVAIKHGLRIV